MENVVLQTADGKRVVLSDNDVTLYSAPRNPPNTGTDYTRGTDLYVHRARSKNLYFYLHHWSMWAGENNWYELCTKTEAENFLLRKMGGSRWEYLTEKEIEKAKEYGIDLTIETA